MKILTMVDNRGFLYSADVAMAVEGLSGMNYQIDTCVKIDLFIKDINYRSYDLFLGGVPDCRMVLRIMNSSMSKQVDTYPKSLYRFLGRDIRNYKLNEAFKRLDKKEPPFFIKPCSPKLFPATIVSSYEDVNFININESAQVYISSIVKFDTEWRCYIWNGNLVGMYYYMGDWKIRPDFNKVEEMVKAYKDPPVCYTLDVGICEGDTVLIEANDFYAIGNYGLDFSQYAKMLLARWKELIHK